MHMNDEIAQRAYRIYEQEGRPEGRALEHWLVAERQILRERQPARAREAGVGKQQSAQAITKANPSSSGPTPVVRPSAPAPAVAARSDKDVGSSGRFGSKRLTG